MPRLAAWLYLTCSATVVVEAGAPITDVESYDGSDIEIPVFHGGDLNIEMSNKIDNSASVMKIHGGSIYRLTGSFGEHSCFLLNNTKADCVSGAQRIRKSPSRLMQWLN